MRTDEALRYAQERDLDLVEVAPEARPPVCRVLDYSKYKYEQSQKQKAARKHQQQITIREIKFRPKIAEQDYATKKRHVERFLKHKDKVKITIMFRGREVTHPERGQMILDRLAEELDRAGHHRAAPQPRRAQHDDAAGPVQGGPQRHAGQGRRERRERERRGRHAAVAQAAPATAVEDAVPRRRQRRRARAAEAAGRARGRPTTPSRSADAPSRRRRRRRARGLAPPRSGLERRRSRRCTVSARAERALHAGVLQRRRDRRVRRQDEPDLLAAPRRGARAARRRRGSRRCRGSRRPRGRARRPARRSGTRPVIAAPSSPALDMSISPSRRATTTRSIVSKLDVGERRHRAPSRWRMTTSVPASVVRTSSSSTAAAIIFRPRPRLRAARRAPAAGVAHRDGHEAVRRARASSSK